MSLSGRGGWMELDIAFASDWPEAEALEQSALEAGEAVCAVAPELANARLGVSLLFTHDPQVHALNREWRDRDKPTNVLSFPMMARDELLDLATDGPPVMLGDIALAYETCAREATEKGITLGHHAVHLIVHGLLHLAGHDHVDSEAQAEAMENIEIAALAKMGIPDPYGDRDNTGAQQ